MDSEHYLFLSSDDSKDRHPGNTVDDFTVELPRPLKLEGRWVCGLKEVLFSNKLPTGTVYVCADLCQDSLVCDTYAPVLRVVRKSITRSGTVRIFDDPFYVEVRSDHLQRFRIFLRGDRLNPLPSRSAGQFFCTIHLRKQA
jgi:hypothetical protein